MAKIYLIVPYEIKDNLKKTEKILWDTDAKLWYCEEITDGLKDYEIRYIDIEYMDKEECKLKLKSLKCDIFYYCLIVYNIYF